MNPVRCIILLFALLVLPAPALAQASQPAKAKAVVAQVTKAVPKAPSKAVAPAKAVQAAPVAQATPKAPAASQPVKRAVAVAVPASLPAVPAKAAPASAPSSQPAPVASWRVWLAANWYLILVGILIPALLNGLKKKGVRKGFIGFLEALLDRLSVATNHNSPGTWKAPLTSSKPPLELPKTPKE